MSNKKSKSFINAFNAENDTQQWCLIVDNKCGLFASESAAKEAFYVVANDCGSCQLLAPMTKRHDPDVEPTRVSTVIAIDIVRRHKVKSQRHDDKCHLIDMMLGKIGVLPTALVDRLNVRTGWDWDYPHGLSNEKEIKAYIANR